MFKSHIIKSYSNNQHADTHMSRVETRPHALTSSSQSSSPNDDNNHNGQSVGPPVPLIRWRAEELWSGSRSHSPNSLHIIYPSTRLGKIHILYRHKCPIDTNTKPNAHGHLKDTHHVGDIRVQVPYKHEHQVPDQINGNH